MIFSYHKDELFVKGEKGIHIEFPANIYKVAMARSNLAVFILDVFDKSIPNTDEFNRNIFAVNDKGEVVWQIEKSPHERPGPYGSGETIPNPFTGMIVDETGQLKVGDASFSYDVDIETGKLSNPEFTR